ncbi:unnamed protein product [Dicrocoelium dendriticum]|nr:unnamed protein product [Dicrocoelium dendriticum]
MSRVENSRRLPLINDVNCRTRKTSAKPVIAEPESASSLSQAAKSPAVGMNGSKQAGLTSPLGNVLSNIVSTAVNAVAMNRDEGTDALCEVCSKTKFADGTSHQCVTCKRRTCARCGYQMNNGVNQLQWLCTPCAQMANEFPPAPSSQISSRRWSRDDVLRDTKLTRGSGLQASSLKRVPEPSVGEKKRKLPVIAGVASDRYVLEGQARFDNHSMIRSSSMDQQDYEQLQPRGITRGSIYTPRQPTSDPRQQHQYWQKFDPSPQSVYRQGSSRPQRSEHYAREAAMRQYYSGAHFPYPEPYEQDLGTESLLSDYADSPSVGNMRPRDNGVYEGGTLMSQDRSDGSETDPCEEAYERTSTHLVNYTADVGRAHSGEYDTDLYESHDEVASPGHSPNSQLYGMAHAGSDVDHSYYGSHGSHTHRPLNARYESHPLKDGFFRQQYHGLAADHLASHRHGTVSVTW